MDPPKGGLGGWVPPGAGGVWGGSFPPRVKASPWPSNPSGGIDTYRPGRPVTEPATAGASPALFSASMAAGASDGETTTQKPVPMLKVANIVTAGTRPASAISAKTGGAGGSASSSYDTSAARRARLSRPPPEMCTRPRGVTPASHSASAARTYTRVGASRASSSRWPVPGTRSASAQPGHLEQRPAGQRVPVAVQARAGQGQDDVALADLRPVHRGAAGRQRADRGADQVEHGRPARRRSQHGADLGDLAAGDGDPGLLSTQVQAAGDLLEDVGVDPVGGQVVQQRERHRPGADHVVDVVGHAVDPDRLPPVRLPGQQDLGADPVGGQRERRPGRDVHHGGEIAAGQAGDVSHHRGPDRGPGQPGAHHPGEHVLFVLLVHACARVRIHAGNATEAMVTSSWAGARSTGRSEYLIFQASLCWH